MMDLGILLLRLTVGLALAAHGTQKVFGWFGGYGPDGTAQFMEALGFRPGRRHALAAGYVELVGGLLLAVGLLTPLAAALIASVMVVAAATVHWKNGFFLASGGYEFNLVLGVAALSLAFIGPGALSLDHAAGFAPAGVAWGLGAAVVALLGALGQLAQRQQSTGTATGAVGTATATESHAH
jgi:putative oxidoreductase